MGFFWPVPRPIENVFIFFLASATKPFFWETFLQNNHKLACAIAAVLSACAAAAHADTTVDAAASSGIDEVVVTATRRSESIQDVPLTIQAITGDQLKQLNVSTFDDAIKR